MNYLNLNKIKIDNFKSPNKFILNNFFHEIIYDFFSDIYRNAYISSKEEKENMAVIVTKISQNVKK